MMVRNGIDCSTALTMESALAIKRAGNDFVVRYLVPEVYKKYLSAQEAQIISEAGLDIGSVFETTANRALSGASGGSADGAIALTCAKKVGQPKGSAIYFAVDFDVTKPEQYDSIEAYLRAAQTALGTDYEAGVYGEYSVINAMYNRKACRHFWQTYAWSANQRSQYANVYQYKNGQTIKGVPFQVDLNNSFGGEGFWSLRKAPKPLTSFTDIPVGHYAEQAIAELRAAGIMVGHSDSVFGFGEPLKREDAAVLIHRLWKEVKKG